MRYSTSLMLSYPQNVSPSASAHRTFGVAVRNEKLCGSYVMKTLCNKEREQSRIKCQQMKQKSNPICVLISNGTLKFHIVSVQHHLL